MQCPKESHGNAMKQCLRYLKGTTSYGLTFEKTRQNASKLIGYSDSSQNVDPDDGRSTTGHILLRKQSNNLVFSETRYSGSVIVRG